jgi:hypothetical protein
LSGVELSPSGEVAGDLLLCRGLANWIQTELEMNLQTGSSAFVRSLEDKYRVTELSVRGRT